jgi:hypothetical protein
MTVRDTGVGIPKNVLSSGLGLAQTRVGKGISINVFLPRMELAVSDYERESVDAKRNSQTRK